MPVAFSSTFNYGEIKYIIKRNFLSISMILFNIQGIMSMKINTGIGIKDGEDFLGIGGAGYFERAMIL